MLKKNGSLIAIIFVGVFCIWNCLNEARWNTYGVMVYDASCYYGYLTVAINHKPDTLTPDEKRIPALYVQNKYEPAPNGNQVLKTTMGMAVVYFPFYAIGYLSHLAIHGNAGTGIEVEYRVAMEFFGTFSLLLGLWLMRKLLKKYFTDEVVAITILAIVLGTNAFYYTTYESAMTHVTNMTLILLFIVVMEKWYSRPRITISIMLGLLTGLMTLIRPTNILVGILFILYDITSISQVKDRIIFIFNKWYLILLMGICAFLIWVPQMIYWHEVTGRFYFYSYVGEEFFFLKPRFFLGLFGWRKGWLIYTPMGVLMLSGFILMYRYVRKMFFSVIIFYISFVYVIFCWWCWWFGGSFSCRPMVESYAVLAFPLASVFQFVFVEKRNNAFRIMFSIILVSLVAFNLFQTWQYKKGIIHWDSMSYPAYKEVFFNTKNIPDSFFQSPDWGKAKRGEYAE